MADGTPPVDQHTSDLTSATDEAFTLLSAVWNDTILDYPDDRCIHHLFEAQAAHTPDALAVVDGRTALTYAELNSRANRVAHALIGLGVGPETRVAILAERSAEMIVGLLGILKAGGCYVPLDPAYPAERLAFMLRDCQAAVTLTQQRLLPLLPEPVRALCLDNLAATNESGGNPACAVDVGNLAYVIYTSGSTGQPKGVMISHRSLSNLVSWHQRAFTVSAADRATQLAGPAFDASVWELWPYLLAGAAIVIPDDETRAQPARLQSWLIDQQISISFVPTPLAERLIGLSWPEHTPLRFLLTGGDALQRYPQSLPFTLVNNYGPTESTVITAAGVVPNASDATLAAPPIGYPIDNAAMLILDAQMQPVPPDTPGEIYIAGAGLARGYLNRPDLTAERFVPNPFSGAAHGIPGTRLYRTGDLARYHTDGQVEFLGRVDHQVKIRGFRIELGEIEAALIQHEAVRECVVVAQQDSPGEKRLVAYVVTGPHPPAPSPTVAGEGEPRGDSPSPAEVGEGAAQPGVRAVQTSGGEGLRAFLSARLPSYMIPAAFVFLESLPLTLHGKIDRRALPAPDSTRPDLQAQFVAPRTPAEELVAGILSDVLLLDQVGIHDNFLALGVHSLAATLVISRLRVVFGIDLSIGALFEAPTVADLGQRIEAARALPDQAPPLQPVASVRPLPLSFAQQRLWFLDQWIPNSPAYNLPLVFHLTGSLAIDVLQHSLNAIISRHAALRTTFSDTLGQPEQIIAPEAHIELPLVDLRDVPAEERMPMAQRLLESEAHQIFDLRRGPLIRAKLVRLAHDEHLFALTIHHIVYDGWSESVLLRELTACYRGITQNKPPLLPPLAIQYADFAIWQRAWMQGEVLEKQLGYWRRQLADLPVLNLPTDFPRPPEQSLNGTQRAFHLPASLNEALQALSRREGVTPFMTLLAAFQTLLFRYSSQRDFAVGVPIAGRNHADIEPLIGFFVNTLVLRADLSSNPTFRDLLGRVRDTTLSAYAHQDLPFEQVVEAIQPERDLSRAPLFQVLFTLQNMPTTTLDLPGLQSARLDMPIQQSRFDLAIFLWDMPDSLKVQVEYSTDLFAAATIDRLIGHFEVLLAAIVANPDQRIDRLPILTEPEQQQIVRAWNTTAEPFPYEQCIHQLFAAQAQRTPTDTALIAGQERLTYAELDQRSTALARVLQAYGVGPEIPVGICLDRTAALLVGLLAILKAGGFYVPLDPAYPAERIQFMLDNSQAPVLLTTRSLHATLPPNAAQPIYLDEALPEIAENPPLVNAVTSGNLAYIIYTSGSTGRPKGVAITHGSAVAMLAWAATIFSSADLAGTLAATSICFDLSVFELFLPLAQGGTVILAENALALPQLPAAQEVTLINTVPSAMAELVRSGALPASVRVVNLAGEPLKNVLAQQIYAQLSVERVYNLYGPSEDTTYSTWALVERDSQAEPTIGRPIANTQAYILDAQLQPVPIGVVGELYLGGAGLARGYLHRPDLTASAFIPDPFSSEPASRLYKTGDLARYHTDGQIEFLGRVDHQVKLRGFRIELGEIEAALLQHEAVRECVVTVRDERLVAYVVKNQEPHGRTENREQRTKKANPSPSPAEAGEGAAQPGVRAVPTSGGEGLRQFLSARLPSYMIPTAFMFLDALPQTATGKLDRRALPAPDSTRPDLQAQFVAPRTPLESILARFFSEVLPVAQIGVHDNIFDLGCHSLLATQIASRISQAFQRPFSVRSLFEAPTIAQLADRMIATEPKQGQTEKIAQILERIKQMSAEDRRKTLQQKKEQ